MGEDVDIDAQAMDGAPASALENAGAVQAAVGAVGGAVDLEMQEDGPDQDNAANDNEAQMDTDTNDGAKNDQNATGAQEAAMAGTEDSQMVDVANNNQEGVVAASEDAMDAQITEADATGGVSGADAGAGGQKPPRVADLSWEDKQLALKNYWNAPWREYQAGDCVDAVDTVQKWCLATVVSKEESGARVHFDGWSSKWDVAYRWTSYRMAPFRRYSRGYTGQPRTPLRQNLSFDLEQLSAERARVEAVAANQFQGMTAFQTTQYLRGGLFVYCDFLLSGTTSAYSEEETEAIDEYLRSVVRLVVAWLLKAATMLKTAVPDMRREPDLFFVDEDVALLASGPELLGLLRRLLCGCHRCLRYYVHYDKNAKPFANPVTNPAHQEQDFKARRTPLEQDYDVDQIRERVLEREDDLVFG